ncbi:MAG: hypothetical protein PHD07_00970 [Bacteroidales bacterium]|nr:hypothetical protein [Bacteroidales bacterium]MDD3200698.1 hypothetical protein [Bacteroidales bacterium]
MSKFYRIFLYVLIFALQLVFDSYINLGPYIYLCLLPLLILILPPEMNVNKLMIVSFVTGLLLDVFSDGVLGLNAAACVMVAALRHSLFAIMVNREGREIHYIPSPRHTGFLRFTAYLAIATTVYLLVYVLFDSASLRPFGFIMLKIFLSLSVNIVVMLIIEYSLINRE